MPSKYEDRNARVKLYRERTGLPKARIERIVDDEEHEGSRLEKRMGATFRKMERLADRNDLTWSQWYRLANLYLTGIQKALRRAGDSLKSAIDALVEAAHYAVELLKAFLRELEKTGRTIASGCSDIYIDVVQTLGLS